MKGTEVTKREHFIGERGLSSIASDSLLLLKAFHTGYWPQLGNSLGVRWGGMLILEDQCVSDEFHGSGKGNSGKHSILD